MKTLGGFATARAFGGVFERKQRRAQSYAIASRDVERSELAVEGSGDVNIFAFEVALSGGIFLTRTGGGEEKNRGAETEINEGNFFHILFVPWE